MKMPAEVSSFRRRIFAAVLFAALAAAVSLPVRADSAATYKTKCTVCHGADGSGNTPSGKKLGAADFKSDAVQKMSDDDLGAVIAKGKNKMPAYEKQLKPDEIKGMVAYIREFAKK
jgi:cytochrome c6